MPAVGQGKRGVEGYLGYLLRQASAATRVAIDRGLADLGVTMPQFLVLTMVKAYPGASGADLARLAQLTPQTVNVITRNLERAGALAKRPDPRHGRILRFALTEEGGRLLAACRLRAHEVEARLASGLTGPEERVVRRWLVEIARAIPDSDRLGADEA